MTVIIETGRESSTHNSLAGHVRYLNKPVLGYALLIILPALLPGCTKPGTRQDVAFTDERTEEVPVKVALLKSGRHEIGVLDVFVFNDDALQRLNCYQRFEAVTESMLKIASGNGRKKIAICANSQRERNEWAYVNSLESLGGITAELEKERSGMPLMTAEADITAGYDYGDAAPLVLSRLSSEIVLRSISCDFSGKPYSGEVLTDVKVYLTNVNASCSIMSSGDTPPQRIINSGRLCPEDIGKFSEPCIVARDIESDIGRNPCQTDITLLCYPNCGTTESPGSPFTRLVIEGNVGSSTWYWPIDINRGIGHPDGNGRGIERNCRYTYDIKIRRKGSSDPDTPANAEDVEINLEIRKWDMKEEYEVQF